MQDSNTPTVTTEQDNKEIFKQNLAARIGTAQSDNLDSTCARYWAYSGHSIIEVQTLYEDGGMRGILVRSAEELAAAAADADADQGVKGTYTHINRLSDSITARVRPGAWYAIGRKGVQGTSGNDFVACTQVMIDVDSERMSGVSATHAEKQAAMLVAGRVYMALASVIGDDHCLAFGDSGNGYQIHVALEPTETSSKQARDEVSAQITSLLAGLAKQYNAPGVHVDQACKDLKRLAPLWGTSKRKGVSTQDRPHRRTWVATSPSPARLSKDKWSALVRRLGAPAPERPNTSTSPAQNGKKSQAWDAVRLEIAKIDPQNLTARLGLSASGNKVECPGCHNDEACSIYQADGHWGYKCFRAACAGQPGGDAGNGAGYRGPVQAVMAVKALDYKAAVLWLCHEYDIAPPKSRMPAAQREEAKASADQQGWVADLARNGGGMILATAANLEAILLNDPALAGKIKYDEFSATTYIDAPWGSGGWKPIKDIDETRLRALIEKTYGVSFGVDLLTRGIESVADYNKCNQVRDYLDELVWDGIPRLSTWLSVYAGAEQTKYTEAAGRYWMISCAKRVYEPGSKLDYMLVLEGPQGLGKSELLATLAGPGWYADCRGDITKRDTMEGLIGAWIVEFAELANVLRHGDAEVKAFLTAKSDRMRLAYGRRTVDIPRMWCAAGTVNPDGGYLRDATGNRRYWPVACTTADVEALRLDRDQVWAEAVAAYKAGEPTYPSRELEAELFAPEQADRREVDVWEADVANYVASKTYASISDILVDLGIDKKSQDARVNARVKRILTALGWAPYPKTKKVGGVVLRVWSRKDGSEPTADSLDLV